MTFLKLQFRPGINRDQTDYSNEGSWWECDKVRFRSGFPEKLGGWVKATDYSFNGTCRQLYTWITTFTDLFVAVGTNTKLYIALAGRFNDITPIRETFVSPVTDNAITVTSGSATVTVTLTSAHGAATGDFVTISGVTNSGADNIGGIPLTEINANVQITVPIGETDIFTFDASTTATSTVGPVGGTATTMAFEINIGSVFSVYGYGWGVGLWGREGWGEGAPVPILELQQDWWFDAFDNDLACNIRDGAPYWWVRGTTTDPTSALNTRAITMQAYATSQGFDPDAVPIKVSQLLVSSQDKHLIAFGAVPFGSTDAADFDPLLIRWADQDTPADWTPTVTNSSGFIRLSSGSRIVRGFVSRQEILVWTDVSLYALQFLGTTDVFGVQLYGDNLSIASPRAVSTAASATYWMGKDKFYVYTGRVETLPCTLLSHVFDNFNADQTDQVVCGTNEEWNEVWWFYPSASASYNDSYVVYNHEAKVWYYGTMERSAWLDTPLWTNPLAANSGGAGTTGYLYNHESGVDDDTLPMESYILSNDFALGSGDKYMITKRLIPDLRFTGSTAATPEALLSMRSRSFPGNALGGDASDTQTVAETGVNQYTEQVFIRARARQMAFKIRSVDLGVKWQLGVPRLDVRESGRR
jgi:hypothetical protein